MYCKNIILFFPILLSLNSFGQHLPKSIEDNLFKGQNSFCLAEDNTPLAYSIITLKSDGSIIDTVKVQDVPGATLDIDYGDNGLLIVDKEKENKFIVTIKKKGMKDIEIRSKVQLNKADTPYFVDCRKKFEEKNQSHEIGSLVQKSCTSQSFFSESGEIFNLDSRVKELTNCYFAKDSVADGGLSCGAALSGNRGEDIYKISGNNLTCLLEGLSGPFQFDQKKWDDWRREKGCSSMQEKELGVYNCLTNAVKGAFQGIFEIVEMLALIMAEAVWKLLYNFIADPILSAPGYLLEKGSEGVEGICSWAKSKKDEPTMVAWLDMKSMVAQISSKCKNWEREIEATRERGENLKDFTNDGGRIFAEGVRSLFGNVKRAWRTASLDEVGDKLSENNEWMGTMLLSKLGEWYENEGSQILDDAKSLNFDKVQNSLGKLPRLFEKIWLSMEKKFNCKKWDGARGTPGAKCIEEGKEECVTCPERIGRACGVFTYLAGGIVGASRTLALTGKASSTGKRVLKNVVDKVPDGIQGTAIAARVAIVKKSTGAKELMAKALRNFDLTKAGYVTVRNEAKRFADAKGMVPYVKGRTVAGIRFGVNALRRRVMTEAQLAAAHARRAAKQALEHKVAPVTEMITSSTPYVAAGDGFIYTVKLGGLSGTVKFYALNIGEANVLLKYLKAKRVAGVLPKKIKILSDKISGLEGNQLFLRQELARATGKIADGKPFRPAKTIQLELDKVTKKLELSSRKLAGLEVRRASPVQQGFEVYQSRVEAQFKDFSFFNNTKAASLVDIAKTYAGHNAIIAAIKKRLNQGTNSPKQLIDELQSGNTAFAEEVGNAQFQSWRAAAQKVVANPKDARSFTLYKKGSGSKIVEPKKLGEAYKGLIGKWLKSGNSPRSLTTIAGRPSDIIRVIVKDNYLMVVTKSGKTMRINRTMAGELNQFLLKNPGETLFIQAQTKSLAELPKYWRLDNFKSATQQVREIQAEGFKTSLQANKTFKDTVNSYLKNEGVTLAKARPEQIASAVRHARVTLGETPTTRSLWQEHLRWYKVRHGHPLLEGLSNAAILEAKRVEEELIKAMENKNSKKEVKGKEVTTRKKS